MRLREIRSRAAQHLNFLFEETVAFTELTQLDTLSGGDAGLLALIDAVLPHPFLDCSDMHTDTPEEDERLKREYFEHNQQAYAALRKSGLLPPLGANLGSQDINEYLRSGMESGEGS